MYIRSSALVAAAISALALSAAPAVAAPVYSNDFEGSTPVGSEWSSALVSSTPGGTHGATRFLGEFGGTTITLHLNSLQPHSQLHLVMDLFLIRTWDGNSEAGVPAMPDVVTITADGAPVLSDTFANWPGETQSYPSGVPGTTNPRQTGAAEVNTLGYTFSNVAMDALYKLNLTIPHTADSVTIAITSSSFEPLASESWGIDNVTLDAVAAATPAPLPSAVLMGPLGALAALWAGRRFRAHA